MIAGTQITEICLLQGVRNNPEAEGVAVKRGHREADPVDGNRSLFDELTPPPNRQGNQEIQVSTLFLHIENFCLGVNVPLDKMSAKAPVNA